MILRTSLNSYSLDREGNVSAQRKVCKYVSLITVAEKEQHCWRRVGVQQCVYVCSYLHNFLYILAKKSFDQMQVHNCILLKWIF